MTAAAAHKPWSWWVSVVLNPNTFQFVGFLLFGGASTIVVLLAGLLLLVVLPLAGYLYYTRRVLHKADPLMVSKRERLIPFAINVLCLLIALWVLPPLATQGMDKHHILTFFYVLGLETFLGFLIWMNLLALGVTLFHKTSLHVIAPTALLCYVAAEGYLDQITSFDLPIGVIGACAIPVLIAAARYREGAHTKVQLASAMLLGVAATVLFFWLEVYLWLPIF
jgi:hypothetical protein